MRCLALAQCWQDLGGHVAFATAEGTSALVARLESEAVPIDDLRAEPGSEDDAAETVCLAEDRAADWIAVDGYHFAAGYQRALKDAGRRILWIDDYGHAAPYCADLVLNQNVRAEEQIYANREDRTRLLLGTSYMLLRREFLAWREWHRRTPPRAERILVSLGGSDPDNVTTTIVEGLETVGCRGLEVRVIVGPANPHADALATACRRSKQRIEIRRNVTDMPAAMAWADLAVSAGGSTCYEMAYMGLPNLAVVLADNQRLIVERLAAKNVAVNLGPCDSLSAAGVGAAIARLIEARDQRAEMAANGRRLVDGHGAARVVEALLCATR